MKNKIFLSLILMTMLFSFQGCSDSEDVANTNAAPQLEFSSNVVSLAESQQQYFGKLNVKSIKVHP